MMRVAVMQPYFMPYAGYFRLFEAADIFVLLDCVQFPRRGWVHRNRLPDAKGEPRWLTLPLAYAPQETAIYDIVMASDAPVRLAAETSRFPSIAAARRAGEPLLAEVTDCGGRLVDYLERLLAAVQRRLGLRADTLRSSSLAIDPALRAQDRIIAIVRALGGREYVNAPGGRALYDEAAFAQAGIRLRFLEPYAGASWSVLHRLLTEDATAIAAEIRAQS